MGNPYLSRNESIILATHRILNRSVLSDMILTNERLILADSYHPEFRPQTIPLITIETVLPGETVAGEPEVTLSVAAPTGQGATVPLTLVFSVGTGLDRFSERDDWIDRIREQIRLVRDMVRDVGGSQETPELYPEQPEISGASPSEKIDDAGKTPEISEPSGAERESASGPQGSPSIELAAAPQELSARFHPPSSEKAKPRRSTIFVIAAVIIFIIVIAGAALVITHSVPGQATILPTQPVQTTAVPTKATPVPTPTVSATPTPAPTLTTPAPTQAPKVIIPQTGVWVQISYDGNYSGTAGPSGRIRDISGSGDNVYQLPAKDEIVSATIQKLDGTGNLLTVEIYSNGVMVANATSKAPHGIIDLHTTV